MELPHPYNRGFGGPHSQWSREGSATIALGEYCPAEVLRFPSTKGTQTCFCKFVAYSLKSETMLASDPLTWSALATGGVTQRPLRASLW